MYVVYTRWFIKYIIKLNLSPALRNNFRLVHRHLILTRISMTFKSNVKYFVQKLFATKLSIIGQKGTGGNVLRLAQLCAVCFSDGVRARLRLPAGERNDPAGSRRYLHLRGEEPRWIPGESFLLRERRSLWQRQGPGNYFTINLCPPVMDYYLIYYYLLLTLLLSLLLLLLLLHHLYARVPALHSTAFNCTIPPAMKKRNIYTIYTITAAEQPSAPTISVYDIHFHLSADGTYRGTA